MPLFAATIFLGAFLLFQVQPLIGKYILPMFGSAPGVWTTCLLFFQVLLLAGYAYAHLIVSRLSLRAQAITHAALLGCALLLLPITPSAPGGVDAGGDPTWPILLLLAASVGVPYFLLSATAPLLQSWFARTWPGRSPYRLYALSNAGSMLALLSYPILVEPYLGLELQTIVWSVAFLAFVLVCVLCAKRSSKAVARSGDSAAGESSPEAPPRPRLPIIGLWLALSACGAGLLMATTNRLCADVAVVPFLWVLPLALYLLSFVLCFAGDRWYPRPLFVALLPVVLAAVCVHLHKGVDAPITWQIAVGAGAFFVCLMCCHGELVRLRPHARHLTGFYLAISVGGALGGLFVAVVAPVIFNGIWEYHLLLGACYVLVLFSAVRAIRRRAGEPARSLASRIGSAACWSIFAVATVAFTLLFFDKESWLRKEVTGEDALRLDDLISAGRLVALVIVLITLIAGLIGLLRKPSGKPRSAGGLFRAVLLGAGCLGAVPLFGMLGWHVFGGQQFLIERDRNFYGELQIVTFDQERTILALKHGRIKHGIQNQDPRLRPWPSSYYGPLSGLGIAIRRHPDRFEPGRRFRIGVVGLGAGTVAAYGNALVLPNVGLPPYVAPRRYHPPNHVVFYEINPLVVDWSRRHFHYLADAEARGATVETHLGDARIVLERQLDRGEAQAFDVLAIDAFNGDAIPIHLLTNECFETYTRHLAAGGILAVHVSNRHLDLPLVVHRLARHHGWSSVFISDPPQEDHGVEGSDWVLVTRNERFLSVQEIAPLRGADRPTGPLWTDDFSSVFPLLHSLR